MKFIYSFSFFLFLSQLVLAQNPVIFRPGPGLNDGSDEGGINGGKDVYITDWDNITHGIESGFSVSPISNCNNTTMFTLMKFDLSSLPAMVDSVKLVIHHFNPSAYCYSNCMADFHFAVVTQAWSETTVQFTNMPAKDPVPFYSLLNHSWDDSLKIKEYDITQVYLNWKNGTVPNHGFEIYSTTVGCNNACVYIGGYTSDDTTNGGAYRPYLKLYIPSEGIMSPLAEKLGLKCYPNPVNNSASFELTLNTAQKVMFQLFDVSGVSVYKKEYLMMAGKNKITVPVENIDDGLYHYSLETKEGTVAGKVLHK